MTNSGQIVTQGANSIGVLAQAIGGGGGVGAFSLSASGSSGSGTTSSVGGSGGSGGQGGTVSVNNSGVIVTNGALSYGVYAQSIGGGGGVGGFSVAGTLSTGSGGTTSSVGGSGAAAGNGGNVTVTNTGSIEVKGAGSVGVFAQSVGGGGGAGGFSGALGLGGGDLGQTVGGAGGAGGNGGDVTVNSTGSIITTGQDSVAVLAQSIGGGGGQGAFVIGAATGSVSESNLALGSASNGAGGAMGTVIVNVSGGDTETSGDLSYGLLAQSIGAGGGNAALSVPDPLTIGANGSMTLTVGATGGLAGDGNVMNSTNSNPTLTTGAGSIGLIAQSIGGGGGAEGQTGDVVLGSGATIKAVVGGSSTQGGSGDTVTFVNSGAVQTSGDNAGGVLAQSIGGGGGLGAYSLGVITGTPASITLTAGGSEGAYDSGAAVTVTNTATILTTGAQAAGLTAQSIGGGGGVTGFTTTSGVSVTSAVALNLGATGGAGGDGGVVNLSASAAIETKGAGAPGVLAQSIGGGGGAVTFDSEGAQNSNVNVSLGGGTGNGGAVSVTVGPVVTFGAGSAGVIAQSIGGGGGLALANGAVADFVTAPASTGDGEAVSVTTQGVIVTQGTAADGVVAQSIGGGGGFALALTSTGAVSSFPSYVSTSSTGSGGAVSVTVGAPITVLERDSFGVIAQSVGGGGGLFGSGAYQTFFGSYPAYAGSYGWTGSGGTVGLAVNASVAAPGQDSTALLVQSAGGSGTSDISVSIADVAVTGGLGSGHALEILGGANNTVTTAGALSTAGGITGVVIYGDTGNNAVTNTGTITGSIVLGSGLNTLTNQASGLINSGPVVNLAATGLFTNKGTLQPWGAGVVGRRP